MRELEGPFGSGPTASWLLTAFRGIFLRLVKKIMIKSTSDLSQSLFSCIPLLSEHPCLLEPLNTLGRAQRAVPGTAPVALGSGRVHVQGDAWMTEPWMLSMTEKGFAGLPTDSNTLKLICYNKTVSLQKIFQIENVQCAFRSLWREITCTHWNKRGDFRSSC